MTSHLHSWMVLWEITFLREKTRSERLLTTAEMEQTGCWPSQGWGCASLSSPLMLPRITTAWLGCSQAAPVAPSPIGQWETVYSPKARRKPHAWRYPSPFICLHSLLCALNDFPRFILCSAFQWLQSSDALHDKTLVFQLLCQTSTTGA